MYGIDAPESRTSDDVEKIYGMAAKEFVIKWTNSGNLVLKTFKDGKGKYGRILGELWYHDVNINQIMIEEHHAVAYHGQSKEEITEGHIANRNKKTNRFFPGKVWIWNSFGHNKWRNYSN